MRMPPPKLVATVPKYRTRPKPAKAPSHRMGDS